MAKKKVAKRGLNNFGSDEPEQLEFPFMEKTSAALEERKKAAVLRATQDILRKYRTEVIERTRAILETDPELLK